jgi:hypothetical protein
MPSNNVIMVEIDHSGERLTGCPSCNRSQASTGEWCRLAPDDTSSYWRSKGIEGVHHGKRKWPEEWSLLRPSSRYALTKPERGHEAQHRREARHTREVRRKGVKSHKHRRQRIRTGRGDRKPNASPMGIDRDCRTLRSQPESSSVERAPPRDQRLRSIQSNLQTSAWSQKQRQSNLVAWLIH